MWKGRRHGVLPKDSLELMDVSETVARVEFEVLQDVSSRTKAS